MSLTILYLLAAFLVVNCSYKTYNIGGTSCPFLSLTYNLGEGKDSSIILEGWKNKHLFNCVATVQRRYFWDDTHVMINIIMLNTTNCQTFIQHTKIRVCDDKGRVFDSGQIQSIVFGYQIEASNDSQIAFKICATTYKNAPCNDVWNFHCRNGKCISKELVEDGVDNCGDNSDENPNEPCNDEWNFHCRNGNCISKALVDNEVDNCGDNSDEKPPELCSDAWSFHCRNGKCISKALVNDGVDNCGDNSDENPNGFSKGEISGIIIGCLLLKALVSLGICWCRRRTVVTTTAFTRF